MDLYLFGCSPFANKSLLASGTNLNGGQLVPDEWPSSPYARNCPCVHWQRCASEMAQLDLERTVNKSRARQIKFSTPCLICFPLERRPRPQLDHSGKSLTRVCGAIICFVGARLASIRAGAGLRVERMISCGCLCFMAEMEPKALLSSVLLI